MKPTLLVGLYDSLEEHESTTIKSLARNVGNIINTKYGEVRVALINTEASSPSKQVDVLLGRYYDPELPRNRQQNYSYLNKLAQRHILSRTGITLTNYVSQVAWPTIGSVPSNGRYIAKPIQGARSMCQLTFDTYKQTGDTIVEILALVDSNSEKWLREKEKQDGGPSFGNSMLTFGENVQGEHDIDFRYFRYLATKGIHYYPGYQYREGEAIEHCRPGSLYVEELIEDVKAEYRIICVNGQFILGYPRTLVETPGSVVRPLGSQEPSRVRISLEDFETKMPGFESWINALYKEHQYPTWSMDVYRRANGQWGAFEFSCEYSLSDLATEDQENIYSTLVEHWLEVDSDLK